MREEGAGCALVEQRDAVRALELIDLGAEGQFRAALRTCLAKSHDEQAIFDRIFNIYWRVWDHVHYMPLGSIGEERKSSRPADRPQRKNRGDFISIREWLNRDDTPEEDMEASGYSPFVMRSRRDFSGFREEDRDDLLKAIEELGRRLALRFGRRQQHTCRSIDLDLRRTLRSSLRRGGELLDLAYQRPARKRLKLVILCDVSRSMELYSRFLLQFLVAFQKRYRRVETFVFSTSLVRVTNILRQDRFRDALAGLSESVPEWSGGTRMGFCFETFLNGYGGDMLDKRSILLITSDGWDTGEIDLLDSTMAQMRRRLRALIWLNPLMGSVDFRPSCRGMQVALKHIDLLAPAHNVESLRELTRSLERLQRGSWVRRPD